MLNQDRYIECYLAASWAGAAIVPLNMRWSIQENADALSDCNRTPCILTKHSSFIPGGHYLATVLGDSDEASKA